MGLEVLDRPFWFEILREEGPFRYAIRCRRLHLGHVQISLWILETREVESYEAPRRSHEYSVPLIVHLRGSEPVSRNPDLRIPHIQILLAYCRFGPS